MTKKKRKAKKAPGNPFTDRPTDKLLDVLLMEKFRDEQDPVIEVLKERKQEATAEILKRIRTLDGSEELSVYSEVLGALCRDEDEYIKFRKEIEKKDPQKASLMIAGYWRLPVIKDKEWIREQVKKSIIPDERLLYHQLLMDRFLDVEAAKEGIYLVLRKNMTGHLQFFRKSLVKLLAYRGLSFMGEELLTMPREEILFFSGAWDETWKLEVEEMKIGEHNIKPLGPDGMLKEEEELLKLGKDRSPKAQLNVLLCIHRFHTGLNEHILPYLDSPSWRVRFEAIYHFIPDNEEKYINKLWEVFDREETSVEEKYAIISILGTCRMEFLFDRFTGILKNKDESVSVRATIPGSIPVPEKLMVEGISESSLLGRWINLLRDITRDTEEHFIVRFSCARLLEERLEEKLFKEWGPMNKKLFQLGSGIKVPVYLHTVLQEEMEISGEEVAILKYLGKNINDKLIDMAREQDIVGKLNAIRLMTILPEERTADALLELLPEMIEKQKHMMVQNISQSLSFHQQHRVKIGDFLLELLKKEELDDFVVQCLVTTLCALGQPRVLPVLFRMIEEGKIYGMFWEYMTRAVGKLCNERPRAMEIIEEKMEDDEVPILNSFANNVMQYLIQERNMAMQELQSLN